MYKRLLIVWLCSFCLQDSWAQIAVNNDGTAPNSTAALDVKFTNRGFLPPRLSTVQRNAIVSPATGLTLYNTDLKCLEFYTGSENGWYSPCKAGWSISGNSGTTDGVNFIGTTDNVPFAIRVNNQQAGKIDHLTGNTFYGYQAGKSNLSGQHNTALGSKALFSNINGGANTALGSKSLYSNTGGSENTAVGNESLYSNSIGSNNTACGYTALRNNLSGSHNTAVGSAAMRSNDTGNDNTAAGISAMSSNQDGSCNTAVGASALTSGIHSSFNTAVGSSALWANLGSYNTAVGQNALAHYGSGQYNTATGYSALYQNTGDYNCGYGCYALNNNSSGTGNAALGYEALMNNLSGNYNTAVGGYSLFLNTTGYWNTAFGRSALQANSDGANNTSVGYYSMYKNTHGSGNTATGREVLTNNTGGSNNTAVGVMVLAGNQTGIYNTVSGYNSISASTCTNQNYIAVVGTVAGMLSTYGDNYCSMGYFANFSVSPNQINIGNSYVTWIGGQVGWSTMSDKRFKKNVQENVPGLAFISLLRPVTYSWDIRKLDKYAGIPDSLTENEIIKQARTGQESIVYTGFLAQQVERAAERSGYTFSGVSRSPGNKYLCGLSYESLTVPLVKAVQELNGTIELKQQYMDDQKQSIDEMRSEVKNLKERCMRVIKTMKNQ